MILRKSLILSLLLLAASLPGYSQSASSYISRTVAGVFPLGDNGPATSALLEGPQAAAADASGNLYIADSGNGAIRKVGRNGVITSVLGYSGNAYDLKRRLGAGMVGELSAGFWLTDLLALVPQQVSPIAKVSPADWYGARFFPDFVAQGRGFAFGSVSESVLGFGYADAVLRGTTLGILAAIVHRWAE